MDFDAVVTFESDRGDPRVYRAEINDSDESRAAQRAVFRASAEAGRTKWGSVVIVLTKREAGQSARLTGGEAQAHGAA